jgi:hypothetical protein
LGSKLKSWRELRKDDVGEVPGDRAIRLQEWNDIAGLGQITFEETDIQRAIKGGVTGYTQDIKR